MKPGEHHSGMVLGCLQYLRKYDCAIPGTAQGQAGWGFEQPGLVEGVPAYGRGLELYEL